MVPTKIQENLKASPGYQPGGASFFKGLRHSRTSLFLGKRGVSEDGLLFLRHVPQPTFAMRAHVYLFLFRNPFVTASLAIKLW